MFVWRGAVQVAREPVSTRGSRTPGAHQQAGPASDL